LTKKTAKFNNSDDQNRQLVVLPATNAVMQIPQNLEAEQALLANLLHSNLIYENLESFLQAEHFCDPIHQKVFAAIARIINKGQVADVITLRDYFEKDKELIDVGGANYLADLAASVISPGNSQEYARIIHDLHLRRQLIHLSHEISTGAHEVQMESTAQQQIEVAEQFLYEISEKGEFDKTSVTFHTALKKSIEHVENAFKRGKDKIVGVTSGLRDLDHWLGGLHPSDLIIVAGRPSMGKTALVTNIAFNAAKAALDKKVEGGAVVFFSLEMSAEQLALRILSHETGISSNNIRRGDLVSDDFYKFDQVARELYALPLFIDDTPGLSITALRSRARRLKRKENISLIIVDYLQLLSGPGGRKNDNRTQELSEITRQLKTIAKELNVPVIALSQLSRAVESRDDKRPQLSDLRESGSIEQDADIVMFIYRQAYYEERKEPEKSDAEKHFQWQEKMGNIANISELIIAKQRHGPVGTLQLFFDPKFTKFGDLAKDNMIKKNN